MARGDIVARIQSLSQAGKTSIPYGYANGKFFPILVGGRQSGPVRIVPGVVLRDGVQSQVAVLEQDLLLCIGDIVVTGPSTMATIEFLIGGRVGINCDTPVEIVTERSVVDGQISWSRFLRKNLMTMFKANAKTLKQPIEIQTNGGTLGGIKG